MDKTNATISIANFILERTGEKYAGVAITLIGFIIGLPIFCDSGFIVLSGLLYSLGKKVKNSQVFFTVCLAGSLYAVHCLVPPHPGITAAAGLMNVELGQTMLLGIFLAIPGTLVAYFWAKYSGKKYQQLYSESTVLQEDTINLSTLNLPNPLHSFLPIIIPIALISLKSIILLDPTIFSENILSFIKLVGEPIVALFIGILISITLFEKIEKIILNHLLETAIEKAGPILAIIAIPGYTEQVAKSRRAEAMRGLGDLQLRQERWRSSHTTYGTYVNLGSPTVDNYTLTVTTPTATGYVITATRSASQAGDRCGNFVMTVASGVAIKSLSGGSNSSNCNWP